MPATDSQISYGSMKYILKLVTKQLLPKIICESLPAAGRCGIKLNKMTEHDII